MKTIVRTVIAVVLIGCMPCGLGFATDGERSQEVEPADIEIINDLDMFENWDDLQNAKIFEVDLDDENNPGVDNEE